MKFSSIKYTVKEALAGIIRHPLATLATISTMVLMLSLLSTFLVFSENAKAVSEDIEKDSTVLLIWMDYDLDEKIPEMLKTLLETDEDIDDFVLLKPDKPAKPSDLASSEEAETSDLDVAETLEGPDASPGGQEPATEAYRFLISLKEPELAEQFKHRYREEAENYGELTFSLPDENLNLEDFSDYHLLMTLTEDTGGFLIEKLSKALDEELLVTSHEIKSPAENLADFKKDLGENAGDILGDFDENLLPFTFTVRLSDSSRIANFSRNYELFPGVRKIEYSQPVLDFFRKMRLAVNSATLLVFFILAGVSFFIISNMVRLAILSKSKEINIMKYVGASNAYIRTPYVLGGAITGFIGAALSIALSLGLYKSVYQKLLEMQADISFFTPLEPTDLYVKIVLVNLVLGMFFGMFGSYVSVKRHIKV